MALQDLLSAQSTWLSQVTALLQKVAFRPRYVPFSTTANLSSNLVHASHTLDADVVLTVGTIGLGTANRYAFVADGVHTVTVTGAEEALGSVGFLNSAGLTSTLVIWFDGYRALYAWQCTHADYVTANAANITLNGQPLFLNDAAIHWTA